MLTIYELPLEEQEQLQVHQLIQAFDKSGVPYEKQQQVLTLVDNLYKALPDNRNKEAQKLKNFVYYDMDWGINSANSYRIKMIILSIIGYFCATTKTYSSTCAVSDALMKRAMNSQEAQCQKLKVPASLGTFQMVLVGDSGVGKTSLIRRCTDGDGDFCDKHEPTKHPDFSSKIIESGEQKLSLQIWDTVGNTKIGKIKKINDPYVKGARLVALVFDLTDEESFSNLQQYLPESRNDNVQYVVLGNKSDLKDYRKVSVEDATKWAEQQEMQYFEISAKDKADFDVVFEKSLFDTIKKQLERQSCKRQQEKAARKVTEEKLNNDDISTFDHYAHTFNNISAEAFAELSKSDRCFFIDAYRERAYKGLEEEAAVLEPIERINFLSHAKLRSLFYDHLNSTKDPIEIQLINCLIGDAKEEMQFQKLVSCPLNSPVAI